MPKTTTFTNIYYNNQPDGIRVISRTNSTITTHGIQRTLLNDAKKIEGFDRPGIYYLINENDDNKISELYKGQTRNGINRLGDHNRTKDFWNKAILFLADSSNFTLDMMSGLEVHAIKKAFESKRYEVSNQNAPKYKNNFFSKSTVEEIYEEIQFIMATQGYKMDNAKEEVTKSNLLYATIKGVSATGLYSGEKFQVLEGSQINMDSPAYNDKYNKQRVKNC